MCHRDGEQILRNVLPVVQRLIVGVSPMEIEVLIELTVRSGIRKINRFIRLHGNENLDKGKEPGKYAFMGIFLDLIICLANIHTTALQFAMDQRHTIDQQHKVATAIGQNGTSRLKHRLLGNLIATLTCGNFLSIIDFQTDFLAEVQFICRIVALDSNGLAVDKAIELQRCAQTGDLVKNLFHFAVGQRNIVQSVYFAVVFKEDLFPVLDQVFFRFVAQNLRFPTIFFC